MFHVKNQFLDQIQFNKSKIRKKSIQIGVTETILALTIQIEAFFPKKCGENVEWDENCLTDMTFLKGIGFVAWMLFCSNY